MKRATALVLVGVLAVLLAAGLVVRDLLKGAAENDEQVLLALVDAMAVAAEQRDMKALRGFISRDYKDPEGRGYEEMNQLLTIHHLRKGKVSVFIAAKEVEVDREASPLGARMRVSAVLTRGTTLKALPAALPQSAEALDFRLELRKGEGWQLTSARWERIRDIKSLLR